MIIRGLILRLRKLQVQKIVPQKILRYWYPSKWLSFDSDANQRNTNPPDGSYNMDGSGMPAFKWWTWSQPDDKREQEKESRYCALMCVFPPATEWEMLQLRCLGCSVLYYGVNNDAGFTRDVSLCTINGHNNKCALLLLNYQMISDINTQFVHLTPHSLTTYQPCNSSAVQQTLIFPSTPLLPYFQF